MADPDSRSRFLALVVRDQEVNGLETHGNDAARNFRDLYAHQAQLKAFAERAAAHVLTRSEVDAALDALFPRVEGETPRQESNREAAAGKVVSILGSASVPASIRGTAWGLMQAASEFAEHFTARITEAQKQIDAIASRQIDAIGDTAAVYATIAKVTGLSEAR